MHFVPQVKCVIEDKVNVVVTDNFTLILLVSEHSFLHAVDVVMGYLPVRSAIHLHKTHREASVLNDNLFSSSICRTLGRDVHACVPACLGALTGRATSTNIIRSYWWSSVPSTLLTCRTSLSYLRCAISQAHIIVFGNDVERQGSQS